MVIGDKIADIFYAIPLAALILKPENSGFIIVDVNKAYLDVTNSSKAELVGQELFSVFSRNPRKNEPGGWELLRRSLQTVRETGKPDNVPVRKYEVPLRNTGGFSERYWSSENIPVSGEGGGIAFLIHTVKDVTEKVVLEKKQADSRLHQQKMDRLIQEAQQLANVGSWELDPVANEVSWSEKLREIFEVEPEFKSSTEDIVAFFKPGSDREKIKTMLADAIWDGKEFDAELKITTKPGRDRWVRVTGKPQMENGICVRIYGALHDIDYRKKTERELIESGNKYQSLVQAIDGVVWETNVETGEFTFVSPQSEQILGYKPEEWYSGRDFRIKKIHPADRERQAVHYRTMASHQKKRRFEYRMIASDGTPVWIKDMVTYVKRAEGPDLLRGIMIDISSQKVLENERKKALYRLQERVKEQSCLYKISSLSNRASNIDELLDGAVSILPEGWQYPDIAMARIDFEGNVYRTDPFRETPWKMTSTGEVEPGTALSVTVCYAEKKPEIDIGPFYGEEKQLLDTIVENLTLGIRQLKNRQELIKSKTRLKGILDSQTSYYIRTDPDGNYTFYNQKYQDDFGWAYEGHQDLTGLDIRRAVMPCHRERVDDVIRQCIREPGRVFRAELDKPREEGGVRATFWEFVYLHNEEGQTDEIQCSGMDYTDLKNAERAAVKKGRLLNANARVISMLLKYDDWYDALSQSLHTAAEAVDADRVYYFENHRDENSNRLLTSQRLEWAKKNIEPQVNNPDLQNVPWEQYQEFLKPLLRREPFIAVTSKLPEGNTKTILREQKIRSILAMPIYIQDEFHGFLGFDDCSRERVWHEDEIAYLKSITSNLASAIERRKSVKTLKTLNEDLERRSKELMRSNEELEQFAFVTSHDLQEPLRMINSFLVQLERKYGNQLDDKARLYIRYATGGAKRMRKIILDLLEYSRVGSRDEKMEQIDLNELLQELIRQYSKTIGHAGAEIVTDDLPPVYGYRSSLKELFSNLLENSLTYRYSHKKPVIRFTSGESEWFWNVRISDNGIGIHPDYHEKIFNLFQRLHTYEEHSGTGIGLAICKKIAEMHGGTIRVESDEGRGSTFTLTIKKMMYSEENRG